MKERNRVRKDRNKLVDVVRAAIGELGSDWTRPLVRSHIPVQQVSNSQLDRALQNIRRDPSTFSINNSNTNENGRSCIPSILKSFKCGVQLVPREFRDLAIELHGETWGRLLCYLASYLNPRSDFDSDTGVPLPQAVFALSHPYGYNALAQGRHPNRNRATDVWNEDTEEQAPFNLLVSPYVTNKLTRSAVDYSIDDELMDYLFGDDLVEVFTGLSIESPVASNPSGTPGIEEARARLNSQDIEYSTYLPDRATIRQMLAKLPKDSRTHQAAILNRIWNRPNPVYSAVGRTARIYTLGGSFQNLKREIREQVFAGQCQFDLAHAQLSILRKLWDIPALDAYLQADLWQQLMAETGIRDKAPLKTLVYRIAYGSQYTQCLWGLQRNSELSHEDARQALRSPLIRALMAAQKKQFANVRAARSVVDAFGQERIDPRSVKDGKEAPVSDQEIRSALAAQAQSYELKLLLPVLEYLFKQSVPILLWLHDGFICPESAETHYEAIATIVKNGASQLDMNTSLDFERITPTSATVEECLMAA